MEILGIGPSELIFIVVIALIVLGPKDMQKAGKSIGKFLNNLVRSDGWRVFQQTSREIRDLPTNLMREANLELAEAQREILKAMPTIQNPLMGSLPQEAATQPAVEPDVSLPRPPEPENSIQSVAPAATEPDTTTNTPDIPDDKASPPDQHA